MPLENYHFKPTGLLTNKHIQSILASSKARKWFLRRQSSSLREHQRSLLLECGDGVRLHALHSPQPRSSSNPDLAKNNSKLVILIHGWEGSAESTYLLSTASSLFNKGYSILRLHLRDHGPSANLNEDLFHAARLDEIAGAIRNIKTRLPYQTYSLVGFSLGGNIALRISQRSEQERLQLSSVTAISPVISPSDTMDALNSGLAIYRLYFTKKWKRALRAKQRYFPEKYDLSELISKQNLGDMTDQLVENHTPYPSVAEYFSQYTLQPSGFTELNTNTYIIMAKDDPVIPKAGFSGFENSEKLKVYSYANGGHCGFIKNWKLDCWLDEALPKVL